jgi:hypothetical protein
MASPPTTVPCAEAAPALDLLTVPQVMARLQLSRSAVYDLLRVGAWCCRRGRRGG